METSIKSENTFSADNQQGRPKVRPWYICGFVEGEGSFKQDSFHLFQQIVELMEGGLHKTKQGTREIIDLAYQMNGQGKYRKIPKQTYLELLEPSETTCQTPQIRVKI